MSGRLGHKLASAQGAPNSAAEPADQELCLIVDERWGFCCEFQVGDGETYLLPFQRLVFVEISRDAQSLKAVFSSHEVIVKGRNLAEVKAALARSRNLLVRACDARRKGDSRNDVLFISEIEVTELESTAQAPADLAGPGPQPA